MFLKFTTVYDCKFSCSSFLSVGIGACLRTFDSIIFTSSALLYLYTDTRPISLAISLNLVNVYVDTSSTCSFFLASSFISDCRWRIASINSTFSIFPYPTIFMLLANFFRSTTFIFSYPASLAALSSCTRGGDGTTGTGPPLPLISLINSILECFHILAIPICFAISLNCTNFIPPKSSVLSERGRPFIGLVPSSCSGTPPPVEFLIRFTKSAFFNLW